MKQHLKKKILRNVIKSLRMLSPPHSCYCNLIVPGPHPPLLSYSPEMEGREEKRDMGEALIAIVWAAVPR